MALEEAARALHALDGLQLVADPTTALESSDALVIVTDWNEYRHRDFLRMKEALRQPVIIDGRNLYTPEKMRALGFKYRSFGRARA